MVFGGLQKNSFIDYPGKISCVLFTSGCNFDCPYCHNPELVNGCAKYSPFSTENGVYDFLYSRKAFLDGVVISGGEPTLQKDLVSICEKVKNMGYPVKLDTNGSRPLVIKQLLDNGLVDYIAMDIKTDPFNYSPLIKKDFKPDSIISSIRIIMESDS
ncbi:MAG: anaerobic ribonucleoside-triphosphate reductase activating protein, partial [Deltaproteobacteria bacterium]|nr:anaerobic ribonucleoside-triphosphate reductase activating protein [Deltaproteobacteria bacterium]